MILITVNGVKLYRYKSSIFTWRLRKMAKVQWEKPQPLSIPPVIGSRVQVLLDKRNGLLTGVHMIDLRHNLDGLADGKALGIVGHQ
ncbi:MAG: hypothetical protein GY899_17140 [Verrucomicrobiaceae bacterium]|nr:hypothetical protein [Verrucomicrobiaceae bacterium]